MNMKPIALLLILVALASSEPVKLWQAIVAVAMAILQAISKIL
jgi:hypothetical protein